MVKFKYVCRYEGCTSKSRGKSRLCIRHGGGKKCKEPGCFTSVPIINSHKGQYCRRHGGGFRCNMEFCNSVAYYKIGEKYFCGKHTGVLKCVHYNCNSINIAKKTNKYCIKHYRNKIMKCFHPNCLSNAVSPYSSQETAFCKKHGGGITCKIEGCDIKTIYSRKIPYCYKHLSKEYKCQGSKKCVLATGLSKCGKILCRNHKYDGKFCNYPSCKHPVASTEFDSCILHRRNIDVINDINIINKININNNDVNELYKIFDID